MRCGRIKVNHADGATDCGGEGGRERLSCLRLGVDLCRIHYTLQAGEAINVQSLDN